MPAAAIRGGFADPPREAAHAFRAAMTAMARPGRIVRVGGARPPAPLSVAAGTLLLTLADPDTGVYLAGAADTAEVRAWLGFTTGAPAADRHDCRFAVGTWSDLLPLAGYRLGSAEYPDASATLIVEIDRLEADGLSLSGPGIAGTAALSLPAAEPFRANARLFPLGLDFFLTCGDRLAGLPRTTRIGGTG